MNETDEPSDDDLLKVYYAQGAKSLPDALRAIWRTGTAQAWDEGYEAGSDGQSSGGPFLHEEDNPYRNGTGVKHYTVTLLPGETVEWDERGIMHVVRTEEK